MSENLYKFLNGNRSEHGYHEWGIGKWYEVEGNLKMCENGFHASEYVQDALRYVQSDTLAVVEVKGDNIKDDDKQCWREMKVVETYDWSKVESLKLAIYSAEQSKEYFDGDEEIIEDCIDITKKILNEYEHGRTPSEELIEEAESAWAAARLTVWYAARAAKSAAWSAAAWSAKSAVKKDIHQYCLKIIREEED